MSRPRSVSDLERRDISCAFALLLVLYLAALLTA